MLFFSPQIFVKCFFLTPLICIQRVSPVCCTYPGALYSGAISLPFSVVPNGWAQAQDKNPHRRSPLYPHSRIYTYLLETTAGGKWRGGGGLWTVIWGLLCVADWIQKLPQGRSRSATVKYYSIVLIWFFFLTASHLLLKKKKRGTLFHLTPSAPQRPGDCKYPFPRLIINFYIHKKRVIWYNL